MKCSFVGKKGDPACGAFTTDMIPVIMKPICKECAPKLMERIIDFAYSPDEVEKKTNRVYEKDLIDCHWLGVPLFGTILLKRHLEKNGIDLNNFRVVYCPEKGKYWESEVKE